MLLAVLKDIFWQNQFATQDEGLDRDRYFIGLALMLAFVSAMSAGAGILYPSEGNVLMDNFELFNLVSSLYNIHMLLGPVLLVLNMMLARRMFGRWLMVPFGLINSAFINLMPLLANMNNHSARPDDLMVVILLVMVALFVLINIYPAFKTTLANAQPHHPLLRLRPDIDEELQFHAVKFFWRSFQLGLAALVAAIAGVALVLVTKGPRHIDSEVMLWLGLVALITLITGLVFLVRRLRNMSLDPLPTILLLLLLPAAFMIAYAVFYAFDFWDQFWLYLLMFMIFPWIRLMSFALQFMALARCPAEPAAGSTKE